MHHSSHESACMPSLNTTLQSAWAVDGTCADIISEHAPLHAVCQLSNVVHCPTREQSLDVMQVPMDAVFRLGLTLKPAWNAAVRDHRYQVQRSQQAQAASDQHVPARVSSKLSLL